MEIISTQKSELIKEYESGGMEQDTFLDKMSNLLKKAKDSVSRGNKNIIQLDEPIPNKKNLLQTQSIQYFIDKHNGQYFNLYDSTLHVVKWTNRSDTKMMTWFWRDSSKGTGYSYANSEYMDKRFTQLESLAKGRYNDIIEKKNKEKKYIKCEVGTLLITSYGYDQTNVSFFKITKIIGKATVEVTQIGSDISERPSCDMSAYVTPNPNIIIGKPIRCRLRESGVLINGQQGNITKVGNEHYSSWYH